MSLSINGKTAIVTGSANGIGLAIARHFVAMGANVMFADMDEDRLEAEVGADARAEGNVRMFAGDLRQKLTINNLLSATMDAFDRVDILVNASRQVVLSDPLDPDGDAVQAPGTAARRAPAAAPGSRWRRDRASAGTRSRSRPGPSSCAPV